MVWIARVSLVVLAAVAGGCLFGSSDRSHNPFAITDEQRKRLFPTPLTSRRKVEGEVRTARVRVYADQEHRAQAQRWKQRIREIVDGANQVLIPALGLQLEVVELVAWTRPAPGPRLEAALEELEAHDPGDDVDWVIGLVSALSSVTPRMHELGNARPLGKHIVLRGYSDLEERKALGELGTEDIFAVRKHHQETTLVLHEIGHTLGALHAREDSEIMSPVYSTEVSAFAQENVDLMLAVLAARLTPPDKRAPGAEARAMHAHLDSNPRWPGWVDEEYTSTREWLSEAMAEMPQDGAGGTQSAAQSAAHGEPGVPEEARRLVLEVKGLVRAGQYDEAITRLDNMIAAFPASAELRLTLCRTWMAKEPAGQSAVPHCQRVGELDPDDIGGELALAEAHAKAGRLAEAQAALAPATERLASRQGARTEAAWATLLAAYRAMDAVTRVEQALERAPAGAAADEARAWATATRRRFGLPPRAANHRIAPEHEGAYLAEVRGVLSLTYENKHAEARKRAQAALARFPDAPGLLGALCDLEYRARRFDAAHARCTRAVAGYGEASWPRYLLGILELRRKHNQAGIAHLDRAVAMDPELRQAYHALYQAYLRVKDLDGQERVRAAYYQRFGTAIPSR